MAQSLHGSYSIHVFGGLFNCRQQRTDWCLSLWRRQPTQNMEPISRVSGIRPSLVENASVHLTGIHFERYGFPRYKEHNRICWLSRNQKVLSRSFLFWFCNMTSNHIPWRLYLRYTFTMRWKGLERIFNGTYSASLPPSSLYFENWKYAKLVSSSSRPLLL